MLTTNKLKDVLPKEFFDEHMESLAASMLEVDVYEKISGSFDGPDEKWPGSHKNVNVWWKLMNGYAVGFNENPNKGWSFPVVKWTK